MEANTYPTPMKPRRSRYRSSASIVTNREARNARMPRARTATTYAFPKTIIARLSSAIVPSGSDHDGVAASHVRLRLSQSLHDLGHEAVQEEDRRVLEQRAEGGESGLCDRLVRVDQQDHVARVAQLRGPVAGDGDHLRANPSGDVRDLDRAHRRARVRHDQDRVAVADDWRDCFPDEVAVDPELDHPHCESPRREPAPTDAVHEQLLRGRQDVHRLADFLGSLDREAPREVLESVGRRLRGRGRVRGCGPAAFHRRLAPFSFSFSFSSFSGFSGFVGRTSRFANTRSRMTFMYIASCSRSGDDETIVRS